MKAPTRTEGDEDTRLNPADQDYQRRVGAISAGEKKAFDGLTSPEHLAKDGVPGSLAGGVRRAENSPGWNTNLSGQGSELPEPLDLKGVFKKKGPIGLIIALLGGGLLIGGGLPLLGSGLLVNLSETLKGNLIDAVPVSQSHWFKRTLRYQMSSNLTGGTCSSVITLRCRYQTMSNRQIQKFERAGFRVEVDSSRSIIPGRSKITALEFEGTRYTANDITSAATSGKNPKLSSALNKAFNPRFTSWVSKGARDLWSKVGISKKKAITGSPDEAKMKSQLKENVAGRGTAMQKAGLVAGENPENPDESGFLDDEGKFLTDAEGEALMEAADESYAEAAEARRAALDAGNSAKVASRAAMKTVLIGTGVVDNVCTAWNIIRAASFAAKYLGALQLIRYANVFLNTADSIKAGDATPEEVEYLSSIIMTPNSQGRTGMDSRGWNYAMYGDVSGIPNFENTVSNVDSSGALTDVGADNALLEAEVTNYVNGQITGDSIVAELARLSGKGGNATDALDSTCGFVKSTVGQVAVIGVGAAVLTACIVSGIFTAGSTAAGCFTGQGVAMGVVGAIIGVTVNLLSPQLIAMATDTLITGDENGNEAVNAITSGAGATNSQLGLATGLGYLNAEDAAQYQQLKNQTKSEMAAIDRHDLSPFDVSNPNTFLGSIFSRLAPTLAKIGNASSVLTTVAALPFQALGGLRSNAAANSMGDADVCPDDDYERLGIATDINCNPIVGQSAGTLSLDIDEILNYMEGAYVDATTGAAVPGSEYENYLNYCVNRSLAFGAFPEGNRNDTTTGKNCMEGQGGQQYQMFRAYQSISQVQGVMDEEYIEDETGGQTTVDTGVVASPVADGFGMSSGFGPRARPCRGCSTWHLGQDFTNRTDRTVKAMMSGEVISVDKSGGNNTVKIKHADGLISLYLHMYASDIVVNKGDQVTAGQKIGLIGNSGNSTGAHLHFELDITQVVNASVYEGYTKNAGGFSPPGTRIDPRQFLASKGVPGM